MYNYGTATLIDCTLSGNSAGNGGGVYNDGTATLTACTISGNSANKGGGVFLLSGADSRTTIVDTIVAGNSSKTSPDLSGTVDQDQGYNLIGDGDGSSGFTAAGDQVGTGASPINPRLAPLGEYGGTTQTMGLLGGSPAIGKGFAIAGITTDQRGFALDAPQPDIGAFQSTLVVNTTTDARYGLLSPPGELSVRQAVGLADFLGGTQTITFDPAVFATAQTIALTGGQLALSDTSGLETITGPAAGVTIDAGGASRVFQVDSGVTAALSGLTLTGGGSARFGGGLYNSGTVALTDCTVSGNTGGNGGGLFDKGTATLVDCTFNGNSAAYGGGLYNYPGGTVTLIDCTISGNSVGEEGGGMWGLGTATITACTISGNYARGFGTGGVVNYSRQSTMGETIVAGNGGPDLIWAGGDQGYNLIGDGTEAFDAPNFTAAGDQEGTEFSPIDPLLAPLGDYGGPTQTMALLPGSPAIGKGVAIAGITTDQRGLAMDAPQPDIGAFQSTLVVNTTTDAGYGLLSPAGELSLSQAVGLADFLGGNQTITFDPTAFATAQTIALTAGQLELSDTSGLLSIDGPAAGLTIDAGGKSGVFQVDGGATAALSGLTITGGSALAGGGLENFGTITLTDCTISDNSASSFGGGLCDVGTATLTDCTISGNSATFGGGVNAYGPLTLTACTVSGNSAAYGGGVFLVSSPDSRTTIGDTIVAGNAAITNPDFVGMVDQDLGSNLIGDGDGASGLTAAGDQVGSGNSPINPRLAPLGDYGGPTQTMPLLPGSPAIGMGVAIAGITTDQRGFALDAPQPDIGAFQNDPLVVNTTSDASDGTGSLPGILSLRLAVKLANIDGAGTITFAPTVFAAPQTIALTDGPLELSETSGLLSIDGPAAGLTIDAEGQNIFFNNLFQVYLGVTAALSGLTLTGGSNSLGSSGHGGGVYNIGTITLTDCTISGNSASPGFPNSKGFGGGLYNEGTATLIDCTISGNSAAYGGGIFNLSTVTLTDCTISGNSATGSGGGLWNDGTATLTDCTISGNSASHGGGVILASGPDSRTTIVDTIVAGNSAKTSPDLSGKVDQDRGFNLIGDGDGASGFTAAGDQVGTAASPINPRLAPLGYYGGPTQTMALRTGSPAIGQGTTVAGLTADQRGFALDAPRPDIGAFQSNPLVVNTTGDGSGLPPGILSLRQAVSLANIVGAGTITFDPTAFAAHETISLTAGQLELSNLGGLETITGPAAGLTINAGGTSGVFHEDGGVTAALSGLTITGGSAKLGGGLLNFGTVTLTDCTISGNVANDGGGGIFNYGTVTLTDCTISGNSAPRGGGVFNLGTATLTDCTISGNSANEGGGVYVFRYTSVLTLTACTISGNCASTEGGGIDLNGFLGYPVAAIGDTIVAGNNAGTGPDVSGIVVDQGSNLIGDGDGARGFTAAGDQVGTAASPIDPLLAPLGDYGGPTQTMALRTGSPAIGKGTTVAGLTADQRGFALDSPQPDIGAFQSNPLVVNTTSDGSGSLPGILEPATGGQPGQRVRRRRDDYFRPDGLRRPSDDRPDGRPARAERPGRARDDHRPGRRPDHRRRRKERRLRGGQWRDRRALRPDHHRRVGHGRRRPGEPRHGHAHRLHGQRQLRDLRRGCGELRHGDDHRFYDQRQLRHPRRRRECLRPSDAHRLHGQRQFGHHWRRRLPPGGPDSRTTIGDTIVAGNAATTSPDFVGTVDQDQVLT